MKYKKAQKFVGRDLTLEVGRGQMKILDNVVYSDGRLDRYVALGFLVRVKEGVSAGPVVASSVLSATPPVVEAVQPQQMTRSPASKVKSGASKVSTKKPAETKPDPEPEPESLPSSTGEVSAVAAADEPITQVDGLAAGESAPMTTPTPEASESTAAQPVSEPVAEPTVAASDAPVASGETVTADQSSTATNIATAPTDPAPDASGRRRQRSKQADKPDDE